MVRKQNKETRKITRSNQNREEDGIKRTYQISHTKKYMKAGYQLRNKVS